MKSNQKTLPIAIEGRLFLYEVRNVARHAQSGKRVYGGGKNDNAAPMLLYAAPYFTRLAHPMQDVYSGQ